MVEILQKREMQKVYLRSSNQIAPATAAVADRRADAHEVDALALFRTIWRGKWLIATVALCFMLLGGLYVFKLADPLYTATSVIALQNRNEQVVDLETVMSGLGSDQASINTEAEVLRSRELAARVVDRLNLIADPEFNVTLREVDPWSPGEMAKTAIGWVKNLIGTPVEPEVRFSERTIRDKTIDSLLSNVSVSTIRQSYVFRITATTESPEKSALIADTLAELYILDQLEVKFQATEKATEWLSDRVAQLKDELERAENEVKSFHAGTELISPERLEILNRQVKDFRDRRSEMVLRLNEVEARIEALAAAQGGDEAAMAAATGLTGAQLGEGEVADLRLQQMLDRARIERDRLESQIAAMDRSIEDLTGQVERQSLDLLKLEQLQREAEASRVIYEYFLGRLKETSVQQGIQQPDSRVLSHAVVPLEPSAPRKLLVLASSLVFGLFAGAALVMLREISDTGFRTPEDVERVTGVTVIGQVPRAPYGHRRKVLDYVATNPTSAMVEAVRNLRTSILLVNVDRPVKVIMLTSSVPGEGKTTLAMTLAQNLATMGKRVLLVEGDLRRRTFTDVFGAQESRGVVSAVVDQVPLAELVHRDKKLAFDVLLGERLTVNAADFFSSDRFAAFVQRAREEYDFVIIDTPPVLLVPDPRVIGQHADVVVYVVHWDKTPRAQVQQGLRSFEMVNVPVSGLVLSQIDPRGMRRYGYTGTYGRGYSKAYYDQ